MALSHYADIYPAAKGPPIAEEIGVKDFHATQIKIGNVQVWKGLREHHLKVNGAVL